MPKKTKAIKVTDQKAKKPWLKKKNSSVYKVETRDPNKTILIVSEGQTEKLYFESFPVLALTVEAIDLGGQSKLKLIEATESIVLNEERSFDEIWCVFDMDFKQGEKEFADFDNAIKSGEAKGYKVAYSNDVFEIWFYLHFDFNDQANHRTFYYKKLGEHWKLNYSKDGKSYDFCNEIYSLLENNDKASQKDAIARAKKLYQGQNKKPYHQQNPVTRVYELVEFLNKNLKR